MTKKILLATVIVVIAQLVACASPAPIVSQQQIDSAHRAGTLADLYDSLDAKLVLEKAGSNNANLLRKQLQGIGQTLAGDLEAKIAGQLDADPGPNGQHKLYRLQQAVSFLEPMKRWEKSRYENLDAAYRQKILQTQAVIEEQLQRLNQLTDQHALSKAALLAELAALHGGSEGEQYSQRRVEYIDELFQSGVVAVDSKHYDDALKLLNSVAQIKDDYPGLQEQLLLVEAGTFEQKFWDALGAGRPDEAYQLFYQLSQSSGFPLVKQQVGETAGDISNYFIALGKKQNEQGQVADAYQAFQRARYIRNQLDQDQGLSDEERQFLDKMEKNFNKVMKQKDLAAALGFLSIIEDMSPHNLLVKRNKRTLSEKVLEAAAVKLVPAPFSNTTQDRAFGRGLSSKVSLFLLQKIPDDIRIIEREHFDELYGKVIKQDSSSYLSYYYVQGEILESEVDTTEKTSNQTKRVVTGYDQVPNPEHASWLKLSKGDKKAIPEPPKALSVAKQEDVNIKATVIKKVGVFSAIFRLVDPFTAKVIFVDSISEKEVYSGESVEGMELGEFMQQVQVANLPADSEILEDLADRVAIKIGERLIAELSHPEKKYEKYAHIAIEEDNMRSVVTNYAYATILAVSKNIEASEFIEQLRHYTLKAGF